MFENALLVKLELLGFNHPELILSYYSLGVYYYKGFEDDIALEYFIKSVELKIKFKRLKHPLLAHAYQTIGVIYRRNNQPIEALASFFKSLNFKYWNIDIAPNRTIDCIGSMIRLFQHDLKYVRKLERKQYLINIKFNEYRLNNMEEKKFDQFISLSEEL